MLKTLPALAALAVASALLVPTVSQAAETDSVRVSYADLNLDTGFGQMKLQRRIAVAANSVCTFGAVSDLRLTTAAAQCRSAAIEAAQPAFRAAIGRHPSVEVLEGAALIVTAH